MPHVAHDIHTVRLVYENYRFLQCGGEDKVEDVSGVIHGPELAQYSRSNRAAVCVGEQVAEEATELLVELAARADGVALPVQTQRHVLHATGEKVYTTCEPTRTRINHNSLSCEQL